MSDLKIVQRLYVRISTVIALIAIAISGIASYFAYEVSLIKAQDVNEALIYQLAQSVTRTAAIAAYVNDEDLAGEITKGLASNNLVSSASIISPPSLNITNGRFDQLGIPISVSLINPFNNDEKIGTLKLYPDAEFIKQGAIYTARQNVLLLLGLSLITAVIVSLFIHKLLTSPIKLLTQSVADIDTASSDSMQKIDIQYSRNDEFGRLLLGINTLINALKNKLNEEQTLRTKTEALEKRFRLIFEQASAGIAVIDSENRIFAHNHAFENAVSCTLDKNKLVTELFLNKDDFVRALEEIKDGSCDDQLSKDLAIIKDGELRFLHCLFANIGDERDLPRNDEGQQLIQLIVYDITERMRRERKVRFEADHDSLTLLKNRRAGEKGLAILHAETLAQKKVFILMMIDLDKFKPVNDTYGHDVGDEVLKVVASCIRHYFNEEHDICVRWGGDEFLIGFSDKEFNQADLAGLSTNLLQDLNSPIELADGPTCHIGASIGIAVAPLHTSDFDSLMRKADEAMYHAKNNGRNQTYFYTD